MALDEPRDDDELFKDNGITYIVNKELFEQAKPIHVDFIESAMGAGFSISSSLKMAGSCGTGCGSTCS